MKMKYIKIESYDELLKYNGQKVFFKWGNEYIPATVGCINDDSGTAKIKTYPEGFLYLGSDDSKVNGGHPEIANIMGTKYAYCVVASKLNYCDLYISLEDLEIQISNELLNEFLN